MGTGTGIGGAISIDGAAIPIGGIAAAANGGTGGGGIE
jgi:hypothetical protein